MANWHFLATGVPYAELFTGPSAVLHFWSLAIEEQFYLAIAVVVGAARPAFDPTGRTMPVGRRRRSGVVLLLVRGRPFGRPI